MRSLQLARPAVVLRVARVGCAPGVLPRLPLRLAARRRHSSRPDRLDRPPAPAGHAGAARRRAGGRVGGERGLERRREGRRALPRPTASAPPWRARPPQPRAQIRRRARGGRAPRRCPARRRSPTTSAFDAVLDEARRAAEGRHARTGAPTWKASSTRQPEALEARELEQHVVLGVQRGHLGRRQPAADPVGAQVRRASRAPARRPSPWPARASRRTAATASRHALEPQRRLALDQHAQRPAARAAAARREHRLVDPGATTRTPARPAPPPPTTRREVRRRPRRSRPAGRAPPPRPAGRPARRRGSSAARGSAGARRAAAPADPTAPPPSSTTWPRPRRRLAGAASAHRHAVARGGVPASPQTTSVAARAPTSRMTPIPPERPSSATRKATRISPRRPRASRPTRSKNALELARAGGSSRSPRRSPAPPPTAARAAPDPPSTRATAAATAPGSAAGMRQFSPSRQKSRLPCASVQTTGTPVAIASSTGRQKPSWREVWTNTVAVLSSSLTSASLGATVVARAERRAELGLDAEQPQLRPRLGQARGTPPRVSGKFFSGFARPSASTARRMALPPERVKRSRSSPGGTAWARRPARAAARRPTATSSRTWNSGR